MEAVFLKYDKFTFAEYVKERNNFNALIINSCAFFSECAKKFDGKVLNKRFVNAVNEKLIDRIGLHKLQDGRNTPLVSLSMYKDVFTTRFNFYFANRGKNICGKWIYFDNECNTTIYASNDSLTNDGRIIGVNLASDADRLSFHTKKEIEKYIDAVNKWDEYMDTLLNIDQYIKDKTKNINTLFIHGGCNYFTEKKSILFDLSVK